MNQLPCRILAASLAIGAAQLAQAQTRELGSSGELLDGIAALVDSGVVLKSELRSRLALVAENFMQDQMQLPPNERGQLPPLSELEQSVLDRLILEEIQIQRAESIGIEIGDDNLNLALAEYAASLGVTLEQLPQLVEDSGESYQSFREEWRRELVIRTLERVDVISKIAINPREFEQCVARAVDSQTDNFEYNTSHILISFATDASTAEIAAAEDRAREVVRQLDAGADFAQLAIANSDSGTALEGGALGWRRGAALPTVFAEDVLEMEPGEHTIPIRGTGGFHIVRLNDMRGGEPQLVDQIRVRHIMLTPTEVLDDEATRQKILGIRDQILGGDEFATVAEAVSEDSLSAVDGGDLDWAEPEAYAGQFGPDFLAAVNGLESGEISEPIRSPDGWHIAEVTGRRSYDMTDELRERQCQQQLGQLRVEEELDIWRRRILDEAYVLKRI
jgi:peptidyl-prolyl cis-trans isomerase SurA